MSITVIAGILGSIATIVGSIWAAVKYIAWKTQKTQDQIDQDIDAQAEKDKHDAEASGRPV